MEEVEEMARIEETQEIVMRWRKERRQRKQKNVIMSD
jgi:hypothetical protein